MNVNNCYYRANPLCLVIPTFKPHDVRAVTSFRNERHLGKRLRSTADGLPLYQNPYPVLLLNKSLWKKTMKVEEKDDDPPVVEREDTIIGNNSSAQTSDCDDSDMRMYRPYLSRHGSETSRTSSNALSQCRRSRFSPQRPAAASWYHLPRWY